MVRPARDGEKGDGMGWCGCEYFNGLIAAKYEAISSAVGGCNSIFAFSPAVEYVGLERVPSVGMTDAASALLPYISNINVLPKFTTGIVAYTGTRLKPGTCLQQCAYAPMCSIVACVSNTMLSVETCCSSS